MKPDTRQQEIILVANSTLSRRQLCEKDASKSNCYLSPIEQLERACWQGMLNELLPEIMQKPMSGRDFYIWQIRQGASSLQIELSEIPLVIEKQFSIAPMFFLPLKIYN